MNNVTDDSTPVSLPQSYKIFLVSKFFTNFGGGLFNILLPWMVLVITKSPAITGIAAALTSIPLLFSFFTGTYVDRIAFKKGLFSLSLIGLSISTLIFGESIYAAGLVPRLILILIPVLFIGFFDDIQDSVSSFFDKALLLEKQITKAQSIRRTIASISVLVGYAIAAYLIILGFHFAVITLSVVYLVGAFSILPITYESKTFENKEKFMQSLVSGMRVFFSNEFMKELFYTASVLNFFFGMLTVSYVVLIEKTFSLNVIYFTAIMIAQQVGVTIGSFYAGRLKNFSGKWLILLVYVWGTLFFVIFLFALIKIYFPLTFIAFLLGLISGVPNVFILSAILKNSPREMISRIVGSIKTLFVGFTFLSGAVAGLILTYIKAPYIFIIIGIPFIIIGIFGSLKFKHLRNAIF